MMKTRLNGTERPKKDAGGLRRVVLTLTVLLFTAVLCTVPVFAEENLIPIAKIGDIEYSNLTTAFDAAKDGDEITLLADIAITGDGIHKVGIDIVDKNLVLNLASHTITATKGTVGDGVFDINSGACLTINGPGKINSSDFQYTAYVIGKGTLIINGGEFTGSAGGCIHKSGIGGKILIYGGSFSCMEYSGKCFVINQQDADVEENAYEIYGGNFLNVNPASCNNEYPALNYVVENYVVTSYEDTDGIWYTVRAGIDADGNYLLYPGGDLPGNVAWTGDATNGYTLSITAPGSYKLMDSFTYAPYTEENRLSIVEGGVTLDLNGNTITATRDASNAGDTAFISVSDKSLTINGNGGGITTTGQSSDSYKACMFLAGKNAQLTINSGTFTSEGIVISENGEVKGSEPVYNNPSIVLNGGTFISRASTPIYMTADEGKLTVANGVAIQGNTAGIEIRSGTAAINGGTITATGTCNYPALNDVPANPISDGSAIVLVSKPNAYDATISLNIAGDATEITSSNGAAIRNYVRSGDGKTEHTASDETIKIAITNNPKLSGSVAAIENAQYAGDTSTIVGTFNLNGGYYKGTEVLKGNPSVSYPAGYSMTTNADENGYHFVTTVTEPNLSEEVTTNPDGTTTVSATSGTITYDAESQTVTMEDTDAGVTLEVTYSEVTEQTETSITGTVNAISTVYDTIDLDDTHAVSLEIQLDTDEPASVIEQLPSVIKSVKEDLVTTALSAEYNNVQIHTLFEALSSDIDGFNGAISDMTITFHISPSAVGTNPNFLVAHFDANGALIDVHTPAVRKDTDGTWRVTITAEKFSGYAPFTGTAKSSGYTSSSSGNMDNAYRVLFNDGATTLSVQTDLSSGDKLTKPETPVKDGYTFAGWYKDSACTQGWDFETGISGDMTLYAKWTAAGSSGETEATTAPTATSTAVTTPQPTKTQTAAATTSAPEATTAAGVSPTLTQAPAPVAGALFGLLAAGVLLRRRFQ